MSKQYLAIAYRIYIRLCRANKFLCSSLKFRDRLSAFFWLAISFIVCAESNRMGIGTFRSPGPGFFPFCLGITLGTFAIILVVTRTSDQEEGKITNLWKGTKLGRAILVLTCLIIYCFLLPILGYLVMTFGLMAALLIVGGKRMWVEIVIALIITWISYVIFGVWLYVPLPKGFLNF